MIQRQAGCDVEKEQKVMTQAQETAELRKWLREDAAKNSLMVADLHKKIDSYAGKNMEQHLCLQKQLAKLDTKASINAVKIVGLASLVSLVVSGLVVAGVGAFAV
jgi:hypothetical protein